MTDREKVSIYRLSSIPRSIYHLSMSTKATYIMSTKATYIMSTKATYIMSTKAPIISHTIGLADISSYKEE